MEENGHRQHDKKNIVAFLHKVKKIGMNLLAFLALAGRKCKDLFSLIGIKNLLCATYGIELLKLGSMVIGLWVVTNSLFCSSAQ